MFGDLVQRRALAEAGDVLVSVFVSLPRMKGADDLRGVFAGVEVSWIEEVVVVLVTKFDFDLLLADVEGVGHVFEKDQA